MSAFNTNSSINSFYRDVSEEEKAANTDLFMYYPVYQTK